MKTLSWILSTAIATFAAIFLWLHSASAPLKLLMVAPRTSVASQVGYIEQNFPHRMAKIPTDERNGNVFTLWAINEADKRAYLLLFVWFVCVVILSLIPTREGKAAMP